MHFINYIPKNLVSSYKLQSVAD